MPSIYAYIGHKEAGGHFVISEDEMDSYLFYHENNTWYCYHMREGFNSIGDFQDYTEILDHINMCPQLLEGE